MDVCVRLGRMVGLEVGVEVGEDVSVEDAWGTGSGVSVGEDAVTEGRVTATGMAILSEAADGAGLKIPERILMDVFPSLSGTKTKIASKTAAVTAAIILLETRRGFSDSFSPARGT